MKYKNPGEFVPDDGAGYPAAVLPPDVRQLLLHVLVQDPVLLADIVSHHSLDRMVNKSII